MIHDALEDPPRATHQEIREEESGRANNVVDVLHIWRCIMEIAQVIIDRWLFPNDYEVMDVVDVMMAKAREAL